MISEEEALGYWRAARAAKVGIALRTNHRSNLATRLYSIKARHREEDFTGLRIKFSNNEVWIVHEELDQPMKVDPIKPMQEGDLDSL